MSITVDFYILNKSQLQSLHFVCQLLEKNYLQKQQVYVQMNSLEEATRFDELLWTFKEESFIPHQVYQEHASDSPLIQIGYMHMTQTVKLHDKLYNLSNEVPAFYQHFTHIIEIVFSDPLVQQLARKRYKQYRDQGHEINTIKS